MPNKYEHGKRFAFDSMLRLCLRELGYDASDPLHELAKLHLSGQAAVVRKIVKRLERTLEAGNIKTAQDAINVLKMYIRDIEELEPLLSLSRSL